MACAATKINIAPGARFGHLVVLERDTTLSASTNHNYRWLCQCDCGKLVSPRGSNLNLGKAMSCGCRTVKHGMHSSPEYRAWIQMRMRCTKPHHPDYHHYGGRGITVCSEWATFEQFYTDMGPRPSPKHSIDRIDNEQGYSAANCRWATATQQVNNRRQRKDHAAGR